MNFYENLKFLNLSIFLLSSKISLFSFFFLDTLKRRYQKYTYEMVLIESEISFTKYKYNNFNDSLLEQRIFIRKKKMNKELYPCLENYFQILSQWFNKIQQNSEEKYQRFACQSTISFTMIIKQFLINKDIETLISITNTSRFRRLWIIISQATKTRIAEKHRGNLDLEIPLPVGSQMNRRDIQRTA